MKNKQFILNILFTLLSFIITTGINFFLTPYITKHIGTEAYAFVSLANNFVNYASIVTLAINSMASRFIAISYHRKNLEDANKYFNSVVITNLFLILMLFLPSVLCIVFLDKILVIPANLQVFVKILFGLVFANFFFGLLNTIFSVATFVKNRVDLTNLRTLESNIIKVFVMIGLFIIFDANIVFVGVASLIATIYLLIFNIWYTKKLIPEIKCSPKYFELKKIVEIFKSGIWNTITKIGQVLSDGLDLLITNWFVTPFAMGQLAYAKTLSSCMSSFSAALSSVFQPNLTSYFAKEKNEDVVEEFKFSMKISCFLSNILLAGLIVFGIDFFNLWIPGQNINLIYAATFVTIIGSIVGTAINSLFSVFTITNKLKINSLVTLTQGLLNIIIVYILLRIGLCRGYEIVLISGVNVFISIVKNLTFTPMYSAYCLNIKKNSFYPTIFNGILSAIILSVIFYIIRIIHIPTSWVALLFSAFICTTFGLIANFLILFNKNQRKKVVDIIKNKLKKGDEAHE